MHESRRHGSDLAFLCVHNRPNTITHFCVEIYEFVAIVVIFTSVAFASIIVSYDDKKFYFNTFTYLSCNNNLISNDFVTGEYHILKPCCRKVSYLIKFAF